MITTTFDETIRAIFHRISQEQLPNGDREWMLRFSFPLPIELAFLQYYKMRLRRWMLLASGLICGFVTLPLAMRQLFFYHSGTSNPTAVVVGLFQSIVLIALILRVRVRYSLPLLSIISLIVFGYTMIRSDALSIDTCLQAAIVTAFAGFMSVLFEYDARRDFLSHARMYRVATTDSLSQVLNRYAFFERGALEVARSRRYGSQLSLLMVDIDHFKQINDRYGHPIGDQVIASLGAACRGHLRTPDLIGRIGGEEFAILLPDTEMLSAIHVAERLRQLVAAKVVSSDIRELRLTISIGVATFGESDRSLQDLITRADACLYTAKRNGRNRVVNEHIPEYEPLAARAVGAA